MVLPLENSGNLLCNFKCLLSLSFNDIISNFPVTALFLPGNLFAGLIFYFLFLKRNLCVRRLFGDVQALNWHSGGLER
jgi:hypothetical protein